MNNPAIFKNPLGVLKKSGDHIAQYFELSGRLLVVFVSVEVGLVAIAVDRTDIESGNWWKSVEENWKKKPSVKIVGPLDLQLLLTPKILAKGYSIESKIVREGTFEVALDFNVSKVRIQKNSSRIKVLIVDDSKSVRTLLHKIFSSDPELDVVAMAELPSQVAGLIESFKPDVMTLDIHMPEMDGLTLLKSILPKYSIPTVMISSVSMEEGPIVLNALEAGAVDYIQKPGLNDIDQMAPLMIEKVKMASRVKVDRQKMGSSRIVSKRVSETVTTGLELSTLIAIGSSTGGTEALRVVLTSLPPTIPPILIVQHIPPLFSRVFAERLNTLCPFNVCEAEDGMKVEANNVYVAPGGRQMRIKKQGAGFVIVVENTEPVNRHKPSVDVLFWSIAQLAPKKTVAAILTGMGADGAKGMADLKKAGAICTIAQDEESCVVFGMPKEAIKAGGVSKILPLNQIGQELISQVNRNSRKAA